MSARKADLLGGLVLLIAAAVSHGHLLEPGTVPYSAHSDVMAHFLGRKEVLWRSLGAGQGIPYWRSDECSGTTALTHPECLYTHPLHVTNFFLAPADAVGPTFFLTLVAAGVGMLVLGRVLEVGAWPRLMMGLAAVYSFKLTAAVYAGWLVITAGAVSIPWALAAFLHSMVKPGVGAALALGITGAVCLHAGHLQLVYYTFWFLLAYGAVAVVRQARTQDWPSLRHTLCCVAAGAGLALGLSAYLLVPLWAEAPLISRGQATFDFFQGNHTLALRHLLTFLCPEALGTPLRGTYAGEELWEDAAYFGAIPQILAIVGVMLGWRRRHTRFLAVSFVGSIVLAFDTPLLRACFDFLPGFRLFRLPSRLLFLATFFGICLAGIGADELARRFYRRVPAWSWAGGIAILILIAAEGTWYARRYLNTAPVAAVLPTPDYARHLARDRDLFRVAPLGRDTLNYGWAARFGLQLVTGYDSFTFRHYQNYCDLLRFGSLAPAEEARVWTDLAAIARPDLLDALNVKYLVSAGPLTIGEDARSALVSEGVFEDQPAFTFYRGMTRKTVHLYRNERWLDRAFWAAEVLGVPNERAMAQAMQLVNARHSAVVLDATSGRVSCPGSVEDRVDIVDASNGRLRLDVSASSRRFLVISEVWHPGWRAQLDGNPHPLFHTDVALLGTWIPAGTHRLEVWFRPAYWPLAAGASILTLGILLVATARWIRQLPTTCRGQTSR